MSYVRLIPEDLFFRDTVSLQCLFRSVYIDLHPSCFFFLNTVFFLSFLSFDVNCFKRLQDGLKRYFDDLKCVTKSIYLVLIYSVGLAKFCYVVCHYCYIVLLCKDFNEPFFYYNVQQKPLQFEDESHKKAFHYVSNFEELKKG